MNKERTGDVEVLERKKHTFFNSKRLKPFVCLKALRCQRGKDQTGFFPLKTNSFLFLAEKKTGYLPPAYS